jgi:NAD(P)-dependent dehydrogenase (short-subunit alcohol dehydrogenase family)
VPQQAQVESSIRNGLAVVTGAGGGLGRALAVELTQRGIRVVGLGRGEAALRKTAELAGSRFIAKLVDVGDDASVQRAFEKLHRESGNITILINNAAVYPRRDFLQETPASFMASMQANFGSVVNCTHAALATMTETGIGHIVNVGSFADLAPLPCSAAYSVSKGAGRIFARALVADLGDRFPDILISTWMPGILATKMGPAGGLDPAVAARWGADLALWHDRSLNGAVFERDHEIIEPRSLKRRVKDRLLLRRPPKPRRLGDRDAPPTGAFALQELKAATFMAAAVTMLSVAVDGS